MDFQKIYNEEYYRSSCGDIPYENVQVWYKHFDIIAEKIVKEINPKTVLDVGCAMGYLVAALRDRGVEAYGIDISEYAISKVRDDIKPFCRVSSALENLPTGFPVKYDLLITIEVIEHLYEEDSIQFLNNITKYSDDILFSSTPDDIFEYSHYNVQQQEYWCRKFVINEFYHDLEYDASFISPQALRFKRDDLSNIRIVENYEKYIRILKFKYNEIYDKNNNEKIESINHLNETLENITLAGQQKDIQIQELQRQKAYIETEIVASLKDKLSLLNNELQMNLHIIEEKEEEIREYSKLFSDIENKKKIYESSYNAIKTSTSWRITKPLRLTITGIRFILFENILSRNLKKVLHSVKNNGFKITLIRIKNKLLSKNISTNQNIIMESNIVLQESSINEFRNRKFRDLQPISHLKIDSNLPRLNIVVDSIEDNSLLSETATALIVGTEMARYNGMPLRVISRNAPVNPANYRNIIKQSGLEPFTNIEFYTDYDRDKEGNAVYKLEISKKDVFLATSWWSAVAIQKTSLRERFFYIIQDLEALECYQGEERFLSSEIMKNGNIDFVINSMSLFQYLKNRITNIGTNGFYFDPAFPKMLNKPGRFINKNKYKMYLYTKQNDPRNMFYYSIELIEFCISIGMLNTKEWDIYYVGQNMPEIVFSNGYKAINFEPKNWNVYCDFLSDIDLAVSLIDVPCPSYPLYEVTSAGGVLLLNSSLDDSNCDECKNIIRAGFEKDEFVQGMRTSLELAKDMQRRENNFKEYSFPTEWNTALVDIVKFMKEKM